MALEHILRPIKIGSLSVRNRIVFPPIDCALHHPHKAVDPRYINFLSSLAENNGVGLIISEFTAVANDQFWVPASRIDSDKFIPDFQELVDRIKSHGAKIFMQLALLGGRAVTGRAIAPSAIESPLYTGIPDELSREEIQWLVQKWVDAACRAQIIGFDGVEVHGGHTYLVGAFMSPHANQREDEYGYDFNGRMRFPTEIIKGIKNACGGDFPVGIKFSAYEALENGITGPLSVDIAQRLEKAGVDYLHVSSSTYMLSGTKFPDVPPLYVPEGPLVVFAEQIKKRAMVPVITVAGIASPEVAEKIIADGKADMVAVGRAMFADQHWVSKISQGKESEITPCIRCNVCHKRIVIDRAGAVECTVNPGILQEAIVPTSKKKKIIVVGAGPAGLEAALLASDRGHDVFLYEKKDSIGGNLIPGSIPPFKKDLRRLFDYYQKRLEKSSIQTTLNHEVVESQLQREGADAVIIATGAEEIMPNIPGIDQKEVISAKEFYMRGDLQQKGKGRVAIIGAGDVGCEVAWYLSLLGRKVYLMDKLPREGLLEDEHPTNRSILFESLDEIGVNILDNANIVELGRENRHVKLTREDVECRVFVDNIIISTGYKKKSVMAHALRARWVKYELPEIYEVGDCVQPRDIHWAIRDGYDIGVKI
jgi:2,4-dienoyl-CoA reductase-like NADH-dependent reductase (Old Yellow Enzyme family)/thioredoxin reductase